MHSFVKTLFSPRNNQALKREENIFKKKLSKSTRSLNLVETEFNYIFIYNKLFCALLYLNFLLLYTLNCTCLLLIVLCWEVCPCHLLQDTHGEPISQDQDLSEGASHRGRSV